MTGRNLGYIIAIASLSASLAVSIFLNIFICSVLGISNGESFGQLLLAKELVTELGHLNTEQDSGATQKPDTTVPSTTPPTTPEPDEDKPGVEQSLSYSNDFIKVEFLNQTEGLLGPTLRFKVENCSDRVLNISFTDVYIDGYQASLSGGYCGELAVGKKAFVDLTLWQSDWEDFTSWPQEISFIIKTIESDSFFDLDYNVFVLPINQK
jgi:hypothetical protein